MTDLQARLLALRVHAMHCIEECRRVEVDGAKRQREPLALIGSEVPRSVLGARVERETWEEVLSMLGDPAND